MRDPTPRARAAGPRLTSTLVSDEVVWCQPASAQVDTGYRKCIVCVQRVRFSMVREPTNASDRLRGKTAVRPALARPALVGRAMVWLAAVAVALPAAAQGTGATIETFAGGGGDPVALLTRGARKMSTNVARKTLLRKRSPALAGPQLLGSPVVASPPDCGGEGGGVAVGGEGVGDSLGDPGAVRGADRPAGGVDGRAGGECWVAGDRRFEAGACSAVAR